MENQANVNGKRGVALLYTLSVGVILILLSVSLLSLYSAEVHSQTQQQQALQAYWNARSGVERYCLARWIPAGGQYNFAAHGTCRVEHTQEGLLFEGRCGRQRRCILLKNGEPALRSERVP